MAEILPKALIGGKGLIEEVVEFSLILKTARYEKLNFIPGYKNEPSENAKHLRAQKVKETVD